MATMNRFSPLVTRRRQGMQGVAGAEEAAMQGLRQSALVRVEGQRVYLVQP